MSNRRKTQKDRYHRGFLHSPVWFTRRDHWFAAAQQSGSPLCCAACGGTGTKATLELHHLDYTGVTLEHGRWHARERHEDLIALHPCCHELLHRLIDRDRILAQHRSRRDATRIALAHLHPRLQSAATHRVGS